MRERCSEKLVNGNIFYMKKLMEGCYLGTVE
jgi:hypothetical protein